MEIKNITKHMLCFEFYKPNMTDLQMLGNSFCEFCLRIDIPTVGLKCLELPHFSTAFFSRRLFTHYLKTFLKKSQRLQEKNGCMKILTRLYYYDAGFYI